MSDGERTGFRTLVYSGWHRPGRIRALIGAVRAAKLTMIDIDSCEACARCGEPVALIETAHTVKEPKNAPITAALARRAGIPAYSVSYYGEIERTHCHACGRDDERGEITQFLVRQIEPADPWVKLMDAQRYAEFLESLRVGHRCAGTEAA
jgi:hypothetical protein